MRRELIKAFLEAFSVGDAWGKATEYCSRTEIETRLGRITTILPPEKSLTHQDLPYGKVTDDTEQNIYLIRGYAEKGFVDAETTAQCLVRWIEETEAAEKYMGPSSQRALLAIMDGEDMRTSGKLGTTCGGIMRAPSAFLFSTEENLEHNVVECLRPTHYTSIAIESAMAYAFALDSAIKGEAIEQILNRARHGAQRGKLFGNKERSSGVGPSVAERISFLEKIVPELSGEDALKKFLYDIIGSTLASYDVAACVFGIFIFAQKDTLLAIRLSSELGGDTDTIASLAAGLCTLYAGRHNIDRNLVDLVEEVNNLDFSALADLIPKRNQQ